MNEQVDGVPKERGSEKWDILRPVGFMKSM